MTQAYVPSRLFASLAAPGVGDAGTSSVAGQSGCGQALRVSSRLREAEGHFMKINFVNADLVHALVDLPTNLAIGEMMQLLKGGSSHWVNEQNLVPGKFSWGRGYGVFSVSESAVGEVANYIATQEEHHRKRSFAEELKLFVERYGLKWHEE